MTKKKNNLMTSSVIGKLVLGLTGFILIFVFVACFNTFSLSKGFTDLNSIYWITFFSFIMFSLVVPILIIFSYIDMASLSIKEIKESKKYYHLWETYEKTFLGKDSKLCPSDLKNKTRANSDLYFGIEEMVSSKFFNLPVLSDFKNISGIFVGLGILGTFMGFSQFLSNIIESELTFESVLIFEGLKVAFNTSIIGLFSSIIYNLFIYYPLSSLIKSRNRKLCDEIDEEFYVTDERCMRSLSQIIETTEISIDKNFKHMCKEISNVISEERKEFTDQVLGTAELLRIIDESLGEIPKNVKTMSDELNKSVELAKEKTFEMSNECICNISEKLDQLFDSFANRFDVASSNFEHAASEVAKVPEKFKDSVDNIIIPIKENFDSLEKGINNNLSTICENTINKAKELFEAEYAENKKLNSNLIETAEKGLNNIYENVHHKVNIAIKESTDMLGKTITESCEKFCSGINNSISTLKDFSYKTGEVTNEYKILQESLTDMSQRIRESQENIVSGTEEIKDILKEFIKTSLLMEETQKIYNELAESLKFLPSQHKELQNIYREGASILRDSLVVSINEVLEKVNKPTTKRDGEK